MNYEDGTSTSINQTEMIQPTNRLMHCAFSEFIDSKLNRTIRLVSPREGLHQSTDWRKYNLILAQVSLRQASSNNI